jgi:hypothetical protein
MIWQRRMSHGLVLLAQGTRSDVDGSGRNRPDRERYTIQSPTLMVAIVSNPSGFHVGKALPKCSKFNAQYHTNNILVAISDSRRLSWRPQQGKLWSWLHADTTRPHTAKVSTDYVTRNGMKRAPHPAYSPDPAPSDFFLFGSVKRKLMGYRAESESEFLVRIGVILGEIPREVLNAVFFEWMDRLQKCIETNGDDVG